MKKTIPILLRRNSSLLIYGFGQCFNLATPLLVMPYIISVCGIENYGKISVGMAISFFLMVFIDYGSDINGVKEVSINRDNPANLEQIFVTTFGAKLFLLMATIAIASVCFLAIPYFHSESGLFFLGLPILIGQFINPTWFLQGLENFKWITMLTIFSKIVYVVGIFVFINQESDYIYINLFWGIGTVLSHGVTFFLIMRKQGFSFKRTQTEAIRLLLRNNFSLFTSQIFVSLQMYAPLMLIGFLGTNTMAGQFKIIDQVIVIFKTYILLFFNYVYPRVCYLLDKNVQEAMRFWKMYNGLNFLFIALSMLFVYFFAADVTAYFTTSNAEVITGLLQTAVCIPFLQAITVPLKQLILGFNKQKQYISITIIVTIFSLVLLSAVISQFGVLGVLLALLCSEIIMIASFLYHVKNDLFSQQI